MTTTENLLTTYVQAGAKLERAAKGDQSTSAYAKLKRDYANARDAYFAS